MQSELKEKGEDFETIPLGYIKQTKSLVESINRKDREIQGIQKLKDLNQSSESLKIIDSGLNEADEKKHILVTKLSAIRESTNEEFAYRREIKSNQITKLEVKIKDTHGDVDEYNQASIKLFQTQNEHISLIQNNSEFEKILANYSKDEDLQNKAKTHLYDLYKDELNLQTKRLEALEEKNKRIKLNSHLHDKESNEEQLYKSSADIKNCEGRISLLKNEIEIIAADDDSESSKYEINPFYGQEQPTTADPTTKSKPLSESENLKQQIQKLDRLNIETYKQIQDQQLSSAERATLLDELKANELSQKEKWDRLAEIQIKKLDVSVVDSNNSKPIESTQTKDKGAVPKKKPNADKPVINNDAKIKENTKILDSIKQESKVLQKSLAESREVKRLENSASIHEEFILVRNELEQKLQAKSKNQTKQAMQGTSTFTFFGSGNSSASGNKIKIQEKEIKLKQFSR